jgi:CSLREA domain-containing protein
MFLNAFKNLFTSNKALKGIRRRLELLGLEERITPSNSPIIVSSNLDSGTGSLRAAIDLANATAGDDIINFSITGTITLDSQNNTVPASLPTILNANATASGGGGTVGTLTINGPGSSSLIISGLDGGNNNRNFNIFNIASGGNLTISGVTVSGAKTTGFGGAFKNSGILNISTSVISGNTSTSDGGAVGNYGGGTLNIANSTLSDNSASQGGAVANGGTTTISNSTLSSNRSAARGGAIVNNGNFTVTNSTISGNSSLFSGGGIENNSGTLSLSNSTIFANSAVTYGGGIFNGATLTVTNSTLSNNSAAALINSVSGGGGIFNRSGSTLNIANTIIANSTSGGDYAGNGTVNLISSGNGSDPTVPANNIVTQATSSATSAWAQSVTSAQLNLGPLQNNGGPTQTLALLNGSVAIGAGNASISNASPVNGVDQRGINRTTSDIGAYSFGIQVTNTTTTDNTTSPVSGSLRQAIINANATPGNDQISFNLTGSSSYTITLAGALPTILDATATASGTGGTGTTVGTVTINGLGATVLNISGNNGVSSRNFSIFNIASGGNLSISGVTVSGAKTNSDGGAFRNQGILSVNNSTISGNDGGAFGGGIFNRSGTVTVSNSIFSGNTVFQGGGGICNTGSTGSEGTVTISNSTFSGNTADSGGGIMNRSNGGILNISNSTLSGNIANNGGGAIRNYGTLNINNSTISGNNALQGGGIRSDGTLNISNSTISGNNVTFGGGGGIQISSGISTITNSTISGNTSNGSDGGGGVLIQSGTVTISNSTLSGNSASIGGGLRNRYGTLNIANTIIANSTSGGDYVGGNNATIGTNTNNLVEDGSISGAIAADPLLGPLANNGGPTFTMALLAGSPAISTTPGTGTDQRGINRNTSDIGAYSYGIQVNTTADTIDSDPNVTSLREAITLANTTAGDDQISFNLTGSSSYTITLASALPPIVSASTSVSGGTAGAVTITGLGASSLTIDASGGGFSIFSIDTGGNLSISGVTVSGANLNGNGGAFNNAGTLSIANSTLSGNIANNGGGIFNNGALTVSNSTLSGNSATSGSGGGITNSGTLTVNNSTLSGNSATATGGGINNSSGTLNITNSTLSGNTATGNGGGIFNFGTLNIANTIIANSTSNSTSGGDFVGGQPVFSTNNIVEDGSITSGALAVDPFLGTLANNGGPTKTIALTSLSPISVTAGGNATVSNAAPISGKDQRGYARSTSAPSIGAFEYNGIAPAPTVNNISPVTGPTVGGTSITITGTYFTGATAVTIGGTAATNFTVVNDSTITVTTPAHAAGTASVVVTTPGGTNATNALFTYAAAPTVTSISPTSGPIAGGTSITIIGSNFTGATGVTIDNVAATNLVVNSPTSITVTTPAHAAGTASVVVTTPGGTNATNTLFTYFGAATQANITTLPAGSASGSPFTTQPVITIMDALGNTVTNSTASVTMMVSSGATTLGTTTVNAVNGVATFTNVGISGIAGTAYTLTFTSNGLTSATQSITPTFGTATQAIISTNAAGSVSGSAFTTQPVITIKDAFGNTVTNSTASVTMTVSTGATTLGTTTVNAVAGVATFTNVGISGTAGTAYTLTFASNGLTSGTQSITPLGAANTPTFGTPTSTANGFTVLITNYDPNFTYGGTAAPNGTVAISSNGLVTVSGAAGTSSTATITTTRTNYVSGSAQVTATSLNAANTPTFGAPTATTDGFTVLITNYDPNFNYGGTATANGTVAISSTGLVTVSGVAANTSSTATITTTRNNHLTGSGQVTANSLAPTAPLVTGTPPPTSSGGSSTVTLYDPVTGAETGTAVPFPGFSGPVKVASGDFNSDGVADIIAGAGVGGGPAIAILDSQTGQVIEAFFAFDQAFTGGVFIAVQDTNGDGILDIIASAGPGGGPEVRIFNGANLNLLRSFYAYAEDFSGGVSVASIDFNNDGILDLVTGAGPGGGPHVKVFDGATNAIISQWYAYPASFTGGVFVAVGDIGNDGTFEVVTGAGQGGSPVVAVWDPNTGALLAQFMAYAEDFTGGVRVGINDGNSDGIADILTGAGPGGGPQVNVFSFPALDLLFSFYSGDPANTGGVFVS